MAQTKRIPVPEASASTLFGSYDENLRHFESVFGVRIRTQGSELVVDGAGSGADQVERVVQQLSALMRDGYKLANGDVKTAAGGTVGEKAKSALFEIRHLGLGKETQDIEGEDQDGKRFKLSDYRGKVVLLDFWSEL